MCMCVYLYVEFLSVLISFFSFLTLAHAREGYCSQSVCVCVCVCECVCVCVCVCVCLSVNNFSRKP